MVSIYSHLLVHVQNVKKHSSGYQYIAYELVGLKNAPVAYRNLEEISTSMILPTSLKHDFNGFDTLLRWVYGVLIIWRQNI